MDECVFCSIAAGKLSCNKVYEDDKFMGFLDIRPLTRGNSLVIPKQHFRWVDEVPDFGEYFEVARKVGQAAKKALGAEWISFITIGQEVPHAHIRVVPRYTDDLHGDLVDIGKFEKLTEAELSEIAEKMREGGI